jgi:putative aldouronate transport system substrate-binding protein
MIPGGTKMRRKMVSVILTVAMMGTMLAGCGNKAAGEYSEHTGGIRN